MANRRPAGSVASGPSRSRRQAGSAQKSAGRAPRRLRGRPPRSSPGQQARLVDAALACYLRQGITATTLRDIAAKAGVTPAMVHYYFGGASGVLERVIAERLMPVFDAVRAALSDADTEDPMQLATRFVDAVFDVVARHPWWPALWVREVLSEGGALRDLLVSRVAPGMARGLAQHFARAQQAGRLNPALDPRLVTVTLVGLTLFPAAGAPIWQRLFSDGKLTLDDVRRHALALLAGGLKGSMS